MIVVVFPLLVLLATSCDYFKVKEEGSDTEDGIKVARVYDKYLLAKDVGGIVPDGTSPEDSVALVKRYIKNWVKKQLLIEEAFNKIEVDQQEIERKVLDYRYALIVYEYEKHYVNSELNREVNEEEIEAYYKEHKDDFELKQNIIKGIYLKVPKEAPRINTVKDIIKLKNEGDREKLKSYAYRFAADFMLDDGAWVNFEEIINNTPLASIPNKVQWLKENKYIEVSDNDYHYFLKINDFKITNEISPIEFVTDQIRTIIINKRKAELAGKLEEKIYEKAKANEVFEIYSE